MSSSPRDIVEPNDTEPGIIEVSLLPLRVTPIPGILNLVISVLPMTTVLLVAALALAPYPIVILLDPVAILVPALRPIATLLLPEVTLFKDPLPIETLSCPVVCED